MNCPPEFVEDIQSHAQSELIDAGYDADQVDMMSERVILVDDSDNILGSMSKVEAHQGEGVLHRAFSILLFDVDNRLLMQ